jgi:hypothetical protein
MEMVTLQVMVDDRFSRTLSSYFVLAFSDSKN